MAQSRTSIAAFLCVLKVAVSVSVLAGTAKAEPARHYDPFCGPRAAQIMVLGTYHMSNPGLDARNIEADDVLSSRRQSELRDLSERLARFRPTDIMVEAPYGDPAVQRAYEEYRAGTHELTRNEVQQIGFRLARRLDLPRVTGIDFPMRMSGLRPDELNPDWRPTPTPDTKDSEGDAPPAPKLSAEEKLLRRSTVAEYLLHLNDAERIESDHSSNYLELLLPEDSPALYQRSDYLVNWYKRNFRMFANIARETDFPEDRVLVLVGAGHLKILRDLAREASYFCLVDPIPYLRSSAPS